jgi:hypothetical protein
VMALVLCHFNDAYLPALAPNWHGLRRERFPEAVVTCGGDVFNPSMISTVTKGRHVPPLLNQLEVAKTASLVLPPLTAVRWTSASLATTTWTLG